MVRKGAGSPHEKSKATMRLVGGAHVVRYVEEPPPQLVRPPEAVDGSSDNLGLAIRSRRKSLGRTMQDVAQEAQLSQPFLSQIERGQALPSMRSLDRIAQALGTSGVSLLSGDPSGGGVDLIRAGDRASLVQGDGDPGSHATALTPTDRQLRAIEFVGGWREFQDYSVHHNDEMVLVLAGSYEADVDGETHELTTGDSISYAGGTPHRYRILGNGPHRFLAVIVPDEFDVVARTPVGAGARSRTRATTPVPSPTSGSCGAP